MRTRDLLIAAGIGAAAGIAYGYARSRSSVATPGRLPPSSSSPTGGATMTFVPSGDFSPPDFSTPEAFFQGLEDYWLPTGAANPRFTQRSRQIYEAVKAGRSDPLVFADVSLEWNGHAATVPVLADVLSVFGTRVDVDQFYAQLIADYLGCVVMTRKVADAVWRQAQWKPTPSTYGELNDASFSESLLRGVTVPGTGSSVLRANLRDMSTTAAMLRHSSRCDVKLHQLGAQDVWSGRDLRANMGKDWLLTGVFWQPGSNAATCQAGGMSGAVRNVDSAVNYGWYQPGGAGGFTVIQGAANCHDLRHTDYSQTLRVMGGKMTVDGSEVNTADVLTDSNLAGLLVDERALPGWRHPGVPLDTSAVGV